MTTEDFIASCLMVPTQLIDDLCDEYDVDFSEEDVFEMLNCCAGMMGCSAEIQMQSFRPSNEDKFDFDIDGRDSAIIYDDVRIESKQQLDEIYNKAMEQQLAEI